jgi:hypothetical protein
MPNPVILDGFERSDEAGRFQNRLRGGVVNTMLLRSVYMSVKTRN